MADDPNGERFGVTWQVCCAVLVFPPYCVTPRDWTLLQPDDDADYCPHCTAKFNFVKRSDLLRIWCCDSHYFTGSTIADSAGWSSVVAAVNTASSTR